MIAETNSDEAFSVRGAEVEAVGGGFVAEVFALEFHDLDDGFVHRGEHFRDRVFFFPGGFGARVGEVCHVEGGGVFGVGAAEDVDVGVIAEQVGHIAADGGEV